MSASYDVAAIGNAIVDVIAPAEDAFLAANGLAKAIMCCAHEDPASVGPLLEGYGPLDHPQPEDALWLYTLYHRLTMWAWLKRYGDTPDELLRDLAGWRRASDASEASAAPRARPEPAPVLQEDARSSPA